MGFKLKEIKEILRSHNFDRIAAFKKQKELLLMKRNWTDRLIQLLSYLEKGEQCMSFKKFDMPIQKIKDNKANIVKLAIQLFGSIDKFTETMKHDLEHFSEFMEAQLTEDVSSPKVQAIVREILQFTQKHSDGADLDKPVINVLIESNGIKRCRKCLFCRHVSF